MRHLIAGLGVFAIGLGIGLLVHPGTRTVALSTVTVANDPKATLAPAPIPTRIDNPALDPRSLDPRRLAPIDAQLRSVDYVMKSPRQLIITWSRVHTTPYGVERWRRYGFAIWQRSRATRTWNRVALLDTPSNNETNLHSYYATLGDISGDRRPEVLVVGDTDGTGGCGVYHLYANRGDAVSQPLNTRFCGDQGTMGFGYGGLVVREGTDYYTRGPHCCFHKVRETWLRWNGQKLVTVHRVVTDNPTPGDAPPR